MTETKSLFCVRTITTFLSLSTADFDDASAVEEKIANAAHIGQHVRQRLEQNGYTVQTIRLATNPFPEWIADMKTAKQQLERLDSVLQKHCIDFCALGPAETPAQLEICCQAVAASPRFSCSATLEATDTVMADAAASCIQKIAHLGNIENAPCHVQDGLGNFRFCVATVKDYIPFFPAARSASGDSNVIRFGIGLENGHLAAHLLAQAKSVRNIRSCFRTGLAQAIQPVQDICLDAAINFEDCTVEFLGTDTSLNPSLAESGSVASALETLDEVKVFGGPGTLAAAAVITECLQSLPGIKLCGYCGLMLPLCEDQRLAQLANQGSIGISDLLCISQVCGVGVDTVPIPGDCSEKELASLLLDVAGSAHRWGKSLSCRVFPVPGKGEGDMTTYDFPRLVNSRVLSLSPST